jgi:hypothetical protein
MASQLEGADAQQSLEMMASMTPTSVEILSGSSDGQTAILQVGGVLDGETVRAEVTLEKTGGLWLATRFSVS